MDPDLDHCLRTGTRDLVFFLIYCQKIILKINVSNIKSPYFQQKTDQVFCWKDGVLYIMEPDPDRFSIDFYWNKLSSSVPECMVKPFWNYHEPHSHFLKKVKADFPSIRLTQQPLKNSDPHLYSFYYLVWSPPTLCKNAQLQPFWNYCETKQDNFRCQITIQNMYCVD